MEGKSTSRKSGAQFRNAKKRRLLAESAQGCKSLRSFFNNKSSGTTAVDEDAHSQINEETDLHDLHKLPEANQAEITDHILEQPEDDNSANIQSDVTTTSQTHPDESQFIPPCEDFAYFLKKRNPNLEEVRTALTNHWRPQRQEECPVSYDSSVKCHRRVLLSLLRDEDDWLAVSRVEGFEGLWCKVCALMKTTDHVKGNKLGYLVSKPLQNYKKLHGKDGHITMHKASQFHLLNMTRKDEMLKRTSQEEKGKDILSLMHLKEKDEISRNRQALQSIIKIVLICAKQNIPLRGHRDDGDVLLSAPDHNDGNFRALVRLAVESGDTALENHLKSSWKNATYVSKTIQNELLCLSTTLVKEKIIHMALKSPFYSIIADETTDSANRELITIALRFAYINGSKLEMHEMPFAVLNLLEAIKQLKEEQRKELGGVDNVEPMAELKMSGENIGNVILNEINKVGLDLNNCVGQGYDGAAAMSSERIGAAAYVKQAAPLADYFHCASHSLNLAASQTVKVLALVSCVDTVKETIRFFHSSAKRNQILMDTIRQEQNQQRKQKLIKLCTTRFVERYKALLCFSELLPHIVAAFDVIKEWDDKESAISARNIQKCVTDFEFLVALEIMARVSGHLIILSESLQAIGQDIARALGDIETTMTIISDDRENVDEAFGGLYNKVLERAAQLDITESKPRVPRRSQYRANANNDCSPKEYFKVNLFIPMLDHVLADMGTRFGIHQQKSMMLSSLIPAFVTNVTFEDLQPAIDKYDIFLSDETTLRAEFRLWQTR